MATLLKPFRSSSSSTTLSLSLPSVPCAVCSAADAGKYKCPRCSTRTCSVQCSKEHKEMQKVVSKQTSPCDGQRPPWQSIIGFSQFKADISIEDQEFMQGIDARLKSSDKAKEKEIKTEKAENKLTTCTPKVKVQLAVDDRYLFQNAQLRRIWLCLDEKYEANGSRHERFSDTIFWTCTVKFVCRCNEKSEIVEKIEETSQNAKETANSIVFSNGSLVDYCGSDESCEENEKMEENKAEKRNENYNNEEEEQREGEIDIDQIGIGEEERDTSSSEEDEEEEDTLEWSSYKVHNIPENIRVATLLRQFLRPKPHGPVISRSQLDMAKLDAFFRASETLLPHSSAGPSSIESGDKLLVYLELALGEKSENEEDNAHMRYYAVDPNQTILDNLRNRHVNGHPTFVVVLRRGNEFGELELPMIDKQEQKLLQEKCGTSGLNDRPKWQNQNFGRRGRGNNHRNNNGRGRGNHHQKHRIDQQNPRPDNFRPQQNHPAVTPFANGPAYFHPYERPPPPQQIPNTFNQTPHHQQFHAFSNSMQGAVGGWYNANGGGNRFCGRGRGGRLR